ncbi:MAG: hypothetical protein JO286_25095, partial [Solirubrobacterales bacterium]|nr:hypothetical protein [Solirubrobacterales bacterium]
EREVLRLLATESSGPEIAGQLYVSVNTLRTHTKHIFPKARREHPPCRGSAGCGARSALTAARSNHHPGSHHLVMCDHHIGS